MAHRVFRDRHGVQWQAWEVHPTLAERRVLRERRKEGRPSPDRRVRRTSRPVLREDLQHGWIAFQSATERRRRAPIPAAWESLSDAQLEEVLELAERFSAPKRLIE
jgi:hypothetical protein